VHAAPNRSSGAQIGDGGDAGDVARTGGTFRKWWWSNKLAFSVDVEKAVATVIDK